MNIDFSFQIIKKIIEQGVHTFCLCPSSRNAPFVEILSRLKEFEVLYFFDERSAAFFALGRAKRDEKPVAVITTSGTAVGEMHPAVIEAYYSNVPLILITADRPSSYKNTAAPQCIDQINIFSKYTRKTFDLEENPQSQWLHLKQKTERIFNTKQSPTKKQPNIDLSNWNKKSPIHINIRFDEPLFNEKEIKNEFQYILSTKYKIQKKSKLTIKEKYQIQSFIKKSSRPIVLLSGLSEKLKNSVESALLSMNYPIYAEPLSNLRESSKLNHLILQSGEEILQESIREKWIDGVIRIGAVPVARFWRNLNEMNYPVLSFSLSDFPGLKNNPKACSLSAFLDEGLSYFLSLNQNSKYKNTSSNHQHQLLLDRDKKQAQNFEKKLQLNSQNEFFWLNWISKQLPKNSHIFLGNSLPIRQWNLSAIREDKNFIYTGNRGANGIDGLLSSFFGLCSFSRPNYCILGDLSTLYDLSAPWILDQMRIYKTHIIVINNFGGKIFLDKFKNPAYLNSHHIDFKHFSQMWNINYQLLEKPLPSFIEIASPSLTEIQIK